MLITASFHKPYTEKIEVWTGLLGMRAQDKDLFDTWNIFVLFIDKRVLWAKWNFDNVNVSSMKCMNDYHNSSRVRHGTHLQLIPVDF